MKKIIAFITAACTFCFVGAGFAQNPLGVSKIIYHVYNNTGQIIYMTAEEGGSPMIENNPVLKKLPQGASTITLNVSPYTTHKSPSSFQYRVIFQPDGNGSSYTTALLNSDWNYATESKMSCLSDGSFATQQCSVMTTFNGNEHIIVRLNKVVA